MVLVDSSVWIDFFGDTLTPEVEALAAMIGKEQLVIGDLVLTEVLQGIRSDREFRVVRSALRPLTTVSLVSPALAIQSAQNYRFLRAQGITVRKTIDCMIATWCIENNIPLLHSDRDFGPFEKHLGLETM